MTAPTAEERFWARVDVTGGCWLWTGSKTAAGYGNLRWEGGSTYAHRVSYALAVEPIPDGFVIDHLCRRHDCVRPSHLEAVPHAVNVARGLASYAIRTECRQGHDITDQANVYVTPKGERRCRPCQRERDAARCRRVVRAA